MDDTERQSLRKWWTSLSKQEQESVMLEAVDILMESEYIRMLEDADSLYIPYWTATGDEVGTLT